MQPIKETPAVAMYIKDIAKTTPLTREEEVVLTTLARRGNRAARKRVMEANMRFVLGVALTYKTSPLGVGDMVNEGMMGLSRAIDKFDPKTGMKFISYAVWWIRSYIGKAINEYGYSAIRLPANKYKKLFTSMTTGDTSKLNKQEIDLPKDGILLPKKSYSRLHGADEVKILDRKLYTYNAPVSGPYFGYIGCVALCDPANYEALYGKEYEPNSLYMKWDDVSTNEAEEYIRQISDKIRILKPDYVTDADPETGLCDGCGRFR